MQDIRIYWNNKEERAKIAKKHTEEMNLKYSAEISNCAGFTTIYDDDNVKLDIEFEINDNQEIIVEDLDSVSAILKYSDECYSAVLNFASYKNPGGRFIDGSKAQEECLCHESFLYNVLNRFAIVYYAWNDKNKNKALYLNRALYSPNVIFERDDELKKCNVITCAAPNKSAAQKYCNVSSKENSAILRDRIRFVLDIAKKSGVKTLILGAFGCGVFGQNPKEVVSIFKEYLLGEYKIFNKVIFAVPNGQDGNYSSFKETFNS